MLECYDSKHFRFLFNQPTFPELIQVMMIDFQQKTSFEIAAAGFYRSDVLTVASEQRRNRVTVY